MNHIRITMFFLLSAALVHTASALPRFAIRTGAKCQSCHVNPTGKGMRNAFGFNFGSEELPIPTFKEATDLEDFSPSLTQFFSIGADYRTLFFYNQADKTSSFFQMQGNLYFNLRLNKKVSVYVDKELYGSFEAFGLARILPLDGYLKLGQFMPAYGTKVDDHNLFIRGGPYDPRIFGGEFPVGYPIGLNFGAGMEDDGIEIGFAPSIFSLEAGVFNGRPGGGLIGANATRFKTISLRGDATIKTEDINFSIGGSLYNHPSTSGTQTFYGAFGAVSLFKNLTLNSEVDFVKTPFGAADSTGIMYYNELNYLLVTGIDLKLGYEFYDPNKDVKNGAFSVITLGAEVFPLSGVEVRPLYQINMESPKEISNNNTFLLLFHFYL
ncbi:MAG: hypothetical protein KGJ59_12160 [Bacteroidota bacterium]|nr:hypothetical protein [Bacteroidota bacterium]